MDASFPTEEADSKDCAERGNSNHDSNRQQDARMINAKEVLQAQLAQGLGLDRYADIMHGDPASPEFQRAFNGYYRIRRNEEWRQYYYDLFANAKAEHFSFEQIIKELYRLNG